MSCPEQAWETKEGMWGGREDRVQEKDNGSLVVDWMEEKEGQEKLRELGTDS